MKSPYRYCSRCGDELRPSVRDHYEENHEGGPVLCVSCVQEVIQGIPKAIQAIYDAFADALTSALAVDPDEEVEG